jgi:hypothetical protein
MVRTLDPTVVSVLGQAIYHHLPEHIDDCPLGCRQIAGAGPVVFPRDPDPTLDWVVVGRRRDVDEFKVSDTILRVRRDKWIEAGVFAELEAETHAGYDRVIGLDLKFVAFDGEPQRPQVVGARPRLRPTPTINRPHHGPPPCRDQPRQHPAHDRTPRRSPQPLEPNNTASPLSPQVRQVPLLTTSTGTAGAVATHRRPKLPPESPLLSAVRQCSTPPAMRWKREPTTLGA